MAIWTGPSSLFSLFLLMMIGGVVSYEVESSQSRGLANEPGDKRVIKTIQIENGDIYNCVDFYKQPAFDHPALKNQNFHPQMRPSSRPKRKSSAQSYPKNPKITPFGLKDKACPLGTVPIRKMDKNEVNNRVESTWKHHGPTSYSQNSEGTYVAVARSKSPQVYHGVSANLTIHQPIVTEIEYTSGRITLENDPDFIQVGWTVNPIYYKDSQTRMFIYTYAGGRGCSNTDCPGFVIVRSDIPLDSVLAPLSEPRLSLPYVDFFIYQDPANKNWWLEVGHDETPIGFWPEQIFTSLAKSGSYVDCGGEAYHDPTKKLQPGLPPMGTGNLPSKHTESNAYCFNFVIVNQDIKIDMVQDTETYSDDYDKYDVWDKLIPKAPPDTNIYIESEHVVIYGGYIIR